MPERYLDHDGWMEELNDEAAENPTEGGERAYNSMDHADDRDDLHGRDDRGDGSECEADADAAYQGVSLGRMATVETGDLHLDRMAHAVAIDHLRRTGP